MRFVTLFPKVRTATQIFSRILVTAENKRNTTAQDQAELTHSVPPSFFQQDHRHFKLVSRVVTLQEKAKLEHRQGKYWEIAPAMLSPTSNHIGLADQPSLLRKCIA